MKIAAIIPARGGPKRLKDKNIFPLKGKPLIAYAIEACNASVFIDELFVSSDNPEILKISEKFGAIPLRRKEKYSEDNTPKIIAVRQAVLEQDFISKGPFD